MHIPKIEFLVKPIVYTCIHMYTSIYAHTNIFIEPVICADFSHTCKFKFAGFLHVYKCVYTCIHICIHVQKSEYLYIATMVHADLCTPANLRMSSRVYMYAHVNTYLYMHKKICTCTKKYQQKNMYIEPVVRADFNQILQRLMRNDRSRWIARRDYCHLSYQVYIYIYIYLGIYIYIHIHIYT